MSVASIPISRSIDVGPQLVRRDCHFQSFVVLRFLINNHPK